jgi:hypothetical protein
METIVQRHYDKDKHLQLIKNNIKNSERDDYSILIDYQIFYERRKEILSLCTEFVESKISIFKFCENFIKLIDSISLFSNEICNNYEELEQFQTNPQFMNMENFRVKVNFISRILDDFYYLYIYDELYEDDAEPFLDHSSLFLLIHNYTYDLIPFYKEVKEFVDSELEKDASQPSKNPENE